MRLIPGPVARGPQSSDSAALRELRRVLGLDVAAAAAALALTPADYESLEAGRAHLPHPTHWTLAAEALFRARDAARAVARAAEAGR